MTQRIEYQKQSPELFKKFLEFSMAVKHSTIEESIHDLVNIRASQINGCAFCLDMHVKEATIHGERPLRLHHLAIWRESTLFSPRERAALAWTEILTQLPPRACQMTSTTVFAAVREGIVRPDLRGNVDQCMESRERGLPGGTRYVRQGIGLGQIRSVLMLHRRDYEDTS
jgi:AhpD family alkylhydroperoxidase